IGPFWGNGLQRDIAHLPRKGRTRTTTGFVEKRIVEQRATGAFSVWQLSGAGAVGSQVLMGLPVLSRLRKRYASRVAVWPFEVLDAPVALVEIWPSLYKKTIADGPYDHWITDAAQVHVAADIIRMMPQDQLATTLDVPINREGWIFGVTP
ncbi:MAG: molybdopterin molybdenumtransferase MoeA, partial [Octadecabacter sp.]|nr:molybdopterin molybdenumtransferase MoeA [Octadecabacter sp.]